jgi:CsoR family transcriptional regulator, copper-sensing transcriptional repressor
MRSGGRPKSEREARRLRVRRIVGQLNAIERMLDDDRDCPDILMQLLAARRAIKSLSEALIRSHMNHCIEGASSQAEGRRKLRELLTVLERHVE